MGSEIDPVSSRPRGRPSLYQPDFCDRVTELAAKGCGRVEIAADLNVSAKTLNAWMKAHGDFKSAMTLAKDLEYAWWLKTGREKQFDKTWNAGSWALQMRNRFKTWLADKDHPPKTLPPPKLANDVNAEVLRGEIERKLSRLAFVSGAPSLLEGPDGERAGAGEP